jgi:hypothetical protein
VRLRDRLGTVLSGYSNQLKESGHRKYQLKHKDNIEEREMQYADERESQTVGKGKRNSKEVGTRKMHRTSYL